MVSTRIKPLQTPKKALDRFRVYLEPSTSTYVKAQPIGASKFIEQVLKAHINSNPRITNGGHYESSDNKQFTEAS